MYENYDNENTNTNENNNQNNNSYYGENYPYGNQNQNSQNSNGMYPMNQQSNGKKKKKGKALKVTGIVAGSVATVGVAAFLGFTTANNFTNYAKQYLSQQQTASASQSTTDTTQDSNSQSTAGSQIKQVATTSEATDVTVTDVTSVVKANMPAMVSISMTSQQTVSGWGGQQYTYEGQGSGSGILVGKNDTELLVVTNNHVVDGATTLKVTFVDGETVDAQVKGTDSNMDLAVIAIKISDVKDSTLKQLAYATLGDSEALQLGEPVVAIGNALGYGQSVTSGIVSALDVNLEDDDITSSLIQTDAAINAGNSGGALLNTSGQLIGINCAKISSSGSGASVDNMGYAIPISQAKPIIDQLMNKETRSKVDESERGYLGIRGSSVTQELNQSYGVPYGVYVSEVIDGKAAQKAGVTMGDIIVKLDGESVKSMDELSSKLEYYKKGETITVTVSRLTNGTYKEQELTLTLGDLPEEDTSTDSNSTQNNNAQDNSNQNNSNENSDQNDNSTFPFQMLP